MQLANMQQREKTKKSQILFYKVKKWFCVYGLTLEEEVIVGHPDSCIHPFTSIEVRAGSFFSYNAKQLTCLLHFYYNDNLNAKQLRFFRFRGT